MFSGEIGRHDRNSLFETLVGTQVSKAETGATDLSVQVQVLSE
ncbi:hypothetical protein POTTS_288 [Klebsiella phage vB_KpnM_Potts1]|uniref:Uncharacterized protein n=1 Tax=Klebsiella phage vB_KpnM_Potts1 TaxID=2591366 RepID=A0A5B9NPE4_9CAUD|nr:hypothetical protein POTTS_288 [Klebsiella phage vB_KpnM_Potts1]